jgi:hypothetical protein
MTEMMVVELGGARELVPPDARRLRSSLDHQDRPKAVDKQRDRFNEIVERTWNALPGRIALPIRKQRCPYRYVHALALTVEVKSWLSLLSFIIYVRRRIGRGESPRRLREFADPGIEAYVVWTEEAEAWKGSVNFRVVAA